MAVVNATQKGTIVGKLKSLKRGEVKAFPGGTEYVDYSARIVLPNGVSLFNEKRFFSPNNPSEFTAKGISEMESMIETLEEALVNGEELFATYTLGNEFYCRGKLGYARIEHQYEYLSSDPESTSLATMRLSGKTISIGGGKTTAETSVQGAAAAVSAGYIYNQFILSLKLIV